MNFSQGFSTLFVKVSKISERLTDSLYYTFIVLFPAAKQAL